MAINAIIAGTIIWAALSAYIKVEEVEDKKKMKEFENFN